MVTATALHWLEAEPLRRLYGTLPDLLREGGVFLNVDHMCDESAPRLNAALHTLHTGRREQQRRQDSLDWAARWLATPSSPNRQLAVSPCWATRGSPGQTMNGGTGPRRQTGTPRPC